jgi:dTDP-4-amino-4,6-dideoxygalactose transaminase
MEHMIPVTKSFLPPIEEYMAQVQRAYTNQWLTNRGELVKELEEKLSSYLDLQESNILITSNGTIPLQIAIKLLGNGGEIITTPFSYVATTAAIVWEGCTPVFVDIHPEYLTIDETKIEAAITPKTTCILATHVFGNPCNVEAIDAIAKKYNLKVIYDAAHCFGVKYKGKSIFEYGDISTCSFHATKLFHTGEGGALFTKNERLKDQAFLYHAFGHIGDAYYSVGINGKISELSAAMGLSVLPYIDSIINNRNNVSEHYKQLLAESNLKWLNVREDTTYNYAYLPVIFESEKQLTSVVDKLKINSVNPRRYFYPSLNKLPYLCKTTPCPISEDISNRILCLPLYVGLSIEDVNRICEIISTT